MPEPDKQPWEELGFATFAEYAADRDAQIEAATKKAEEAEKKVATPAAPAKPATPATPAAPEAPVDYSKKAKELYSKLTTEQLASVEELGGKLDGEMQALIASDYEAQFNFLEQAIKNGAEKPGGLFDNLKAETPKKSVSELIQENLERIKGGAPGSPGPSGKPKAPATPAAPVKKVRYSPVGGLQTS